MPEGRTASGDHTGSTAAPGSGRTAARIVLALLLIWLGANFAFAIASTGQLEQDSIYYAEVTERIIAGDGATSLSDRRGFAPPRAYPQPFEASTLWPYLLVPFSQATGLPPALVGQVLNSIAILLTIVALAHLAHRTVPGVPGWLVALIAAITISSQWGVRAAVVNETDGVSLLLTSLALLGLARVDRSEPGANRFGTWLGVAALSTLAIAVRFQNLALAFPVVWTILRSRPRLRAGAMAVGVIAGLAIGWPTWTEGIVAFLDPTERGSVFRSVRWLFPLGVVGLVAGWSRFRGLAPIIWMAVGHLLILLACPDPNTEPMWLFGIRHGLPLHLANGVCAIAACRVVGDQAFRPGGARPGPRIAAAALLAVTLVGAAIDNLPRANRLARSWRERTSLAECQPALEYLRAHPLPAGSVLATWHSDLFAHELRIPTLHLRGFQPGFSDRLHNLRSRATHVLVSVRDSPISQVQAAGRRLLALAAELEPESTTLLRFDADGVHVVLLQLQP